MNWLVMVALEQAYTFTVMALTILIFGPLAALRTPTEIFPDVNIPIAEMKTVTIARDLVKTVDISSGVSANGAIVDNPQQSLQDGDPAHVA